MSDARRSGSFSPPRSTSSFSPFSSSSSSSSSATSASGLPASGSLAATTRQSLAAAAHPGPTAAAPSLADRTAVVHAIGPREDLPAPDLVPGAGASGSASVPPSAQLQQRRKRPRDDEAAQARDTDTKSAAPDDAALTPPRIGRPATLGSALASVRFYLAQGRDAGRAFSLEAEIQARLLDGKKMTRGGQQELCNVLADLPLLPAGQRREVAAVLAKVLGRNIDGREWLRKALYSAPYENELDAQEAARCTAYAVGMTLCAFRRYNPTHPGEQHQSIWAGWLQAKQELARSGESRPTRTGSTEDSRVALGLVADIVRDRDCELIFGALARSGTVCEGNLESLLELCFEPAPRCRDSHSGTKNVHELTSVLRVGNAFTPAMHAVLQRVWQHHRATEPAAVLAATAPEAPQAFMAHAVRRILVLDGASNPQGSAQTLRQVMQGKCDGLPMGHGWVVNALIDECAAETAGAFALLLAFVTGTAAEPFDRAAACAAAVFVGCHRLTADERVQLGAGCAALATGGAVQSDVLVAITDESSKSSARLPALRQFAFGYLRGLAGVPDGHRVLATSLWSLWHREARPVPGPGPGPGPASAGTPPFGPVARELTLTLGEAVRAHGSARQMANAVLQRALTSPDFTSCGEGLAVLLESLRGDPPSPEFHSLACELVRAAMQSLPAGPSLDPILAAVKAAIGEDGFSALEAELAKDPLIPSPPADPREAPAHALALLARAEALCKEPQDRPALPAISEIHRRAAQLWLAIQQARRQLPSPTRYANEYQAAVKSLEAARRRLDAFMAADPSPLSDAEVLALWKTLAIGPDAVAAGPRLECATAMAWRLGLARRPAAVQSQVLAARIEALSRSIDISRPALAGDAMLNMLVRAFAEGAIEATDKDLVSTPPALASLASLLEAVVGDLGWAGFTSKLRRHDDTCVEALAASAFQAAVAAGENPRELVSRVVSMAVSASRQNPAWLRAAQSLSFGLFHGLRAGSLPEVVTAWARALMATDESPMRTEMMRCFAIKMDGANDRLRSVLRAIATATHVSGRGELLKRMVATGRNLNHVGSSRVDLQACKLEYSIVSPK